MLLTAEAGCWHAPAGGLPLSGVGTTWSPKGGSSYPHRQASGDAEGHQEDPASHAPSGQRGVRGGPIVEHEDEATRRRPTTTGLPSQPSKRCYASHVQEQLAHRSPPPHHCPRSPPPTTATQGSGSLRSPSGNLYRAGELCPAARPGHDSPRFGCATSGGSSDELAVQAGLPRESLRRPQPIPMRGPTSGTLPAAEPRELRAPPPPGTRLTILLALLSKPLRPPPLLPRPPMSPIGNALSTTRSGSNHRTRNPAPHR